MLSSIKAIQAQQLYRVQPVTINNGSNDRNHNESVNEKNFFARGAYNLEYPSVEGSPVLGRALDIRA